MFQTLLTLSAMDAILSMLANTNVHKPQPLKKETAASRIWILSDLDSRAVKGYSCSPGPHPQVSEEMPPSHLFLSSALRQLKLLWPI